MPRSTASITPRGIASLSPSKGATYWNPNVQFRASGPSGFRNPFSGVPKVTSVSPASVTRFAPSALQATETVKAAATGAKPKQSGKSVPAAKKLAPMEDWSKVTDDDVAVD